MPPPPEQAQEFRTSNTDDDVASTSTAVEDLDDGADEKLDGFTGARTSEDLREWDRETIGAEEEAERLLTGSSAETKSGRRFRQDGGGSRWSRRREKDALEGDQAETEVMYRYSIDENGVGKEVAPEDDTDENSEADFRRLGEVRAHSKKAKHMRVCRFALLHVLIICAFGALLYGAWTISHRHGSTTQVAQTLSNGTHTFAPTTLLISLDGFRADFLSRNLTPTLDNFVRNGVSPKYMLPSFPSLTFPNHFTLATGLHPESHGIVGNTFWDPVSEKEFYYTDPARSMQPEWWTAEPFWLTAELAGVRSAIHMWPGSEAHIGTLEPAYVDKFNGDEPLNRKVDRVLGWLDLPGPEDGHAVEGHPRPQFMAAYVPNVDADGHLYGPNSTEIRSTIQEVDSMMGSIFQGIEERNLTNIVNIVVVSDHGMATTSNRRLVQLEDLIDTSLLEHIDGWPLYGLRPYNHSAEHIQELYTTLLEKSRTDEYAGKFTVRHRDTTMPARFHFSANPRIAPIWIIPHTGWAIVTREDYDVATGLVDGLAYHPRGLHGYDHEHPLMRAIFLARGPAFPHVPGSEVSVFQNTEVYNIICDSLGIEPKPNNGTIRLPFKTTGTHRFQAPIEIPGDDDGAKAKPDDDDNKQDEDEGDNDKVRWWDWIKNQVEAIKGWAKGLLDHAKGSGKKDDDAHG